MKKILINILVIILLFFSAGCSKRNDYFNDKELKKFGLENLQAPNNSSNFYNKSNSFMLFCYMNVSNDDDVINFVSNILNMLENNDLYKIYGYTKGDDMFKNERKIYMSKDINDYLVNSKNYAEDSVTFNAYTIYYSLQDKSKDHIMFVLDVTSYTEQETHYLSGYNLIVSVTKKSISNYIINTE